MPDYKEARELVIEEVTYHKYHNGKTGKFYSQFIQALASDPCIIGYHHCGFIQSWQKHLGGKPTPRAVASSIHSEKPTKSLLNGLPRQICRSMRGTKVE